MAGALLALVPVGGSGQSLAVADPLEDYARVRQILGEVDLGSFTVRPSFGAAATLVGAAHPWAARFGSVGADSARSFTFAHPRFRTFANSRFPVGRNDGPVWQGRGLTTALDMGATATWRALTVTLHPTLRYTQNSRFELAPGTVPGMPEYGYPWRRIDMPQRFGPDPFWTLDPGQSEARLDVRGASLGVSTANLWWGPGIRNAIVMSDNAPGFPHAFLGTTAPVATGVGRFEARWIWGRLAQSEWFDPAVANEERFLTGVVASYSPSFLDGLSVGITRVLYALVPEDGTSLRDYFAAFKTLRKTVFPSPQNPSGHDEHDQLLSLFSRWVLPESGFEVFAEWSRNDAAETLNDLLREPEHSQGYTLGLQKANRLSGERLFVLRSELTHLERSTTFQVRDSPPYYTHDIVTQGYTQRGQIIGAGVGPGGNSQHLGVDLYAPWGRAGAYLERQVHDNDAYYAWALANNAAYCCHDVSFHLGTHALVFVSDFDVGGGMIITREFNRYFFGLDLWNVNLSLSARWRPR